MSAVEQMKMALAEAGYPRAWVEDTGDGTACVDSTIPAEVAWRAARLAGLPRARCLACFLADPFDDFWPERCLARGEGIEDCGADRSGTQ